MTTIYSMEYDEEESNQVTNQVTNQVEELSMQLTSSMRRVIGFCILPRSAQEIMDDIGVTNQYKNRQRHIVSLVEKGILALERNDI